MLSLAKLGRGSEGYYLDAVAKGAEDYYVGRGEAPGYWAGRGAELLGLDGEVTPEVLRAVLAGTAPDGSMLGAANRTVPGFDLTFSVPKSVSVLAALRPELSEQIVDACEVAVARSIAWLEDNACFSRRGHNGVEHVDGDGYVAAAFRHRTSRAGDPQLHWHVLVANTTRGPDGRWRTLDGTRVYPALRTAGFLFEAEMRNELTNRFGVQWRAARNGISEIDGAPKGRSQIEDRLAIKGYSSGRAAQVAALSTRDCKAEPESDQTLRERWQREAESIGFDPASLDRLLDRQSCHLVWCARARQRDPCRAESEGTDAQEVDVHSSRRAARPRRAGHRRSKDRRGRAGHLTAARRSGSGRPRRRRERQRRRRTAFWAADRHGHSPLLDPRAAGVGAADHRPRCSAQHDSSPSASALGHEARARHQARPVR